ncbi:heat shock protein 70 [Piromyces finnis]|uniref:Heat shock protein 70 n=1 Tax=Piromyces finnis TaxID=1754191 RepID=A0A1Y1UY13_9FUNG|nr:heat shock protein 70 [Piromyces finnis]|eukprot:ORX43260.1 heat shock protein 70 [Piromyces finnis]
MSGFIGIDLGTTYSCIAIYRDGHVEVIANYQGHRTTPSCVQINEVQSNLKHWPFKVIERNGKPFIQVEYEGETKEFIPEQISAMILSKLKDYAQDYLGEEVKDVVITVPTYFNDAQRRATVDASRIAGLNVLQIINEPIERVFSYTDLDELDIDKIMLVGEPTRIPKIQQLVTSYFDGKKLNKTVNPDEAVACGAILQQATLSSDQSESIKNINLQDVTTFSIGIEDSNGYMNIIIERNSSLQISRTLFCTTNENNQNSVYISIYEGEERYVRDNFLLGEFILEGITEAPCGETLIELTIDIDKNGIINVSAVEEGTGLSRKLTIKEECKERDKILQESIFSYFDEKKLKRTINPDETVAYKATHQTANQSSDIITKHNAPISEEKEKKDMDSSKIIEESKEFLYDLQFYAFNLLYRIKETDINDETKTNTLSILIDSVLTWIGSNKVNITKEECEERKKILQENANNLFL